MNKNNEIVLDFPLKGEWEALSPPGHHPYALDFVKMDKQKKKYYKKNITSYYLNNVPSDNYYSWNQPIYSPINGKVYQIGKDVTDHKNTNIWKTIILWLNATFKFKPKEINGKLDIRPNVGNYVMIKSEKGYIVFLAHLKNNSILIKENKWVKTGELIGNIGNSGNSTAPHLHINIFDQMEDPLNAKVLPFVFNKYEIFYKDNWDECYLSFPKTKSKIRM